MQISLFSYCKCMRKCLVDLVAKISWSEMMHDVDNHLAFELKQSLSRDPELLKSLMVEERVMVRKRERLLTTIDRFSKSLFVLRSV